MKYEVTLYVTLDDDSNRLEVDAENAKEEVALAIANSVYDLDDMTVTKLEVEEV